MQRILIPDRISGQPPAGKLHEYSGQTMGTTWMVRLVASEGLVKSALPDGIQMELDQVVNQMSHWKTDSDLGRFNQAEAGTWHALPEDFYRVLSYALSVAADSGGAYDPAAGTLVNLWGFGASKRYDEAGFAQPGDAAIRAAMSLPGWRRIDCVQAERCIRQPGGVQLDLSAVAKGYGVDKVARYLEKQGIHDYLVEVGGELRGAGMKPDGQPWWVALEQPSQEESDAEPILLALHGLSVATSGDYRRFYVVDGKLHPHTIDPRSGYPLSNGIASVTVLHEDCMCADALSTAMTVLGVDEGMQFAEDRRLAARFLVRRDGKLVESTSSRFREMLQ